MAHVTVNSRTRNVIGSKRQILANITGNSADYLDVGMYNVRQVNSEGGAITAYTVTKGTPNAGMCRITLTGTISAMDIEVIGD